LKSGKETEVNACFAVQKKIFTPPEADRFDHDLPYSKGGTNLTAVNLPAGGQVKFYLSLQYSYLKTTTIIFNII